MKEPSLPPVDLLRAAAQAARRAHAPYSRYRVGAALRASDGRMFLGSNVENASYGLTLCAERAAVAAAVSAGSRQWTEMAIVASGRPIPIPCGACRQVLAEFCREDFPLWIARAGRLRDARRRQLGSLLPEAFALHRRRS